VQVFQHLGNLHRHVQGLSHRKPPALLQDPLEGLPLDEVHDQVLPAGLDEGIRDPGQIHMLELGEQLGLGLECLQGLGALGRIAEGVGHLLDGPGLLGQTGIADQVDGTHPALAQDPLDHVAA